MCIFLNLHVFWRVFCQEFLQGLSTPVPAALTDVSNISFGFLYWRSHYKYCPVAVSGLGWDRKPPFTTGSIFSRLSPLKTICLLRGSSLALCDSRCRAGLWELLQIVIIFKWNIPPALYSRDIAHRCEGEICMKTSAALRMLMRRSIWDYLPN